jgi:hypothetical protein
VDVSSPLDWVLRVAEMIPTADMSEKSSDVTTVAQPAIEEGGNQQTVRAPLKTIISTIVIVVIFILGLLGYNKFKMA